MERSLKTLIFRYSQAKAAADNAAALMTELKSKIVPLLTASQQSSFEAEYSDGITRKVSMYTTERDDYDAAVLRQHLDGEVYEEIVDVEIKVSLADFREFLGTLPDRSQAIKMLKPKKVVNKQRLEEAFSNGEVPLSAIKKARMVTSTSTSLRLFESSD